MTVPMVAQGRFTTQFPLVIGRVSDVPGVSAPSETVLVCRHGLLSGVDTASFAAVLVEGSDPKGPRLGGYSDLSHLNAGDIVLVDGRNGRTRTLYRKASSHNALFVTERCNSNCLMCSQPPRDVDMLANCLRVIELLETAPPVRLGITGGEPTLLADGFLNIVDRLAKALPDTTITALSNGRTFSDAAFVEKLRAIGHPRLRFSIPFHSDVPDVHDYISQAPGAFRETLAGLYNLEAAGIEVELRVVMHAQSVPRLPQLSEFIWRKLPFVAQVAFMGLEQMGYVKKNWHLLWVDPIDYSETLRVAAKHLVDRGITVSIYNLPLCIVQPELRPLARQSISDHKHTFVEECAGCKSRNDCAGFFISDIARPSRAISAII
ncbi:His-Xaa-Ser system radical SAM maturase HxsC [Rhodomicrobium lacus]|uniref:His-Xaa-Ser system radical SAM maturase HxsC n=1 Tax=Rhodomicrobium lacus TaxID=2498452 RepID=UPI0013DFFEB9|nr:His-Xaa-Ser system radical SAM maturase HxsC [Rhodomicrobium lacus]